MALELSQGSRTTIKWLGFTLSLLAVAFVVRQFVQYWQEIRLADLGLFEWLVLIGMAIAYALISILLGLAWRKILQHLTIRANLRWAIHVYGFSQLGKYLPGNIFHFAGRQVMGMAAGYSGKKLALSTAFELGLLIVSGILTALLLLPLVGFSEWVSMLMYGLSLGLICLLLRYRASLHLSHALLMHSAFLLLTGLLFVLIAGLLTDNQAFDSGLTLLILSSYVVAWLCGLLVPGAPAGMGIRELVLLFLLGSWLSSSELLLAVVLSRVVSLLGDLLFFVGAIQFKPRIAAQGAAQ
ncbi:MAG: hypothetical protein AAF446_01145 [Pseudomonadota bacterium]